MAEATPGPNPLLGPEEVVLRSSAAERGPIPSFTPIPLDEDRLSSLAGEAVPLVTLDDLPEETEARTGLLSGGAERLSVGERALVDPFLPGVSAVPLGTGGSTGPGISPARTSLFGERRARLTSLLSPLGSGPGPNPPPAPDLVMGGGEVCLVQHHQLQEQVQLQE